MTDSWLAAPETGPAQAGGFPLREIVGALMQLDASAGVFLGGSRSLGLAGPDSDFDLVLVHRQPQPVSPASIGQCLAHAGLALQGVSATGGLFGAGVNGRRFEVFQKRYRDLEHAVQQACAGTFNWNMQPLFPHGCLSLLPVSHLAHGRLLAQRDGALSSLRQLALPMPLVLRRSLAQTFMTQASNACVHAAKVSPGGDQAHAMGLLSLFVFSLNIVIFALSGHYPVLEKGGGTLASRLPVAPPGYAQQTQDLWTQGAAGNYAATVAIMRALAAALQSLES
jgi:hypothetical protein